MELFIGHRWTIGLGDGVISYGPDDRVLVEAEVQGLCSIYWSGQLIEQAVRIAQAESGFHTGAWRHTAVEDSRGLFQINVLAWPQFYEFNLFDPQICAYFARRIYDAAGGWSPWASAAKLGFV